VSLAGTTDQRRTRQLRPADDPGQRDRQFSGFERLSAELDGNASACCGHHDRGRSRYFLRNHSTTCERRRSLIAGDKPPIANTERGNADRLIVNHDQRNASDAMTSFGHGYNRSQHSSDPIEWRRSAVVGGCSGKRATYRTRSCAPDRDDRSTWARYPLWRDRNHARRDLSAARWARTFDRRLLAT
jgi:hypothetical protein